jgi:hypothetical protein
MKVTPHVAQNSSRRSSAIDTNGRGEIAFDALPASLDIEYSRASAAFTWEGFDDMVEVPGDGSAELLDDGSRRGETSQLQPWASGDKPKTQYLRSREPSSPK